LCWPERDIFKTARQRFASTVTANAFDNYLSGFFDFS